MSVEFVKFFIQATETVLKTLIGEVPARGKVEIQALDAIQPHGVNVLIGITGQIKGQVIYGMNDAAAKSLCSRMMGGMEVKELDELSQSALSELANMISGNAATYLEQAGVTSDITAPYLHLGAGMAVSLEGQAVIVPFTLADGQLSLVVGLKAANA